MELIKLSMEQKDALTVLLTGRSEHGFGELLKKMVTSKGLDFDLVTLKPAAGPNNQHFSSTMNFKQVFLTNLMETYTEAEEIRIYEDRIRHVTGFRTFFTDYNKRQNGMGGKRTRDPLIAEVIQVADGVTQLDPVTEAAEVQRIINDHNAAVDKGHRGPRLQIKKTIFYTGYLINNEDTQKLLTLANIPQTMPDHELKFLANNVLITPRPCPNSILEKVGGMGSKTRWEVTGTAVFENKIWAASVKPVPETKKYYTENPLPIVVLALRKGARPVEASRIQNWQPVPKEKQYVFDSTVGEKVLLRIEEEDKDESKLESLFPNKSFKRKHADEESDRRTGGHDRGGRGGGFGGNNNANRGGRGNFRGNNTPNRGRGGGGGRGDSRGGRGGRGRGGYQGYKSLDDVSEKPPAPSYNAAVAYEDFPPLQKQYQTPQQLVQQQFDQYNAYQQSLGKGGGRGGGNSGSAAGAGPAELQYS